MNQTQKLLIVDDAEAIHRIVGKHVADLDVEVLSAFDASGGLRLIHEQRPDLVLMDINLPDESGFATCRTLKENPDTYDIAVIFISGAEDAPNKVQAFDLGAVDYITKPFDPSEMKARIRAALNTKSLMDLLRIRAQIDGLTGLHNRTYFDERLEQELAAGRRYNRGVGLLLMDVDHFKRINDTHGHPRGDQVLKSLAKLLRQIGRATDVACRYGGEELAIILTQSSNSDTYRAAIRLLEAIRSNKELATLAGGTLTVSIGAACTAPDEPVTPEALLRDADKALYRAKAEGRNRVATAFDPNKVSAA